MRFHIEHTINLPLFVRLPLGQFGALKRGKDHHQTPGCKPC